MGPGPGRPRWGATGCLQTVFVGLEGRKGSGTFDLSLAGGEVSDMLRERVVPPVGLGRPIAIRPWGRAGPSPRHACPRAGEPREKP